ncbi:unnamed protein product [Lymnaea stagnalis]|uniref:Uncharacterized protein n=1 Tax=Lymnaea stagnalis TaxID=6523 RepID=A0AAV2I464_LYMST
MVEDQTNDIPNARPNSSDSSPLSLGGDLGVESLGRKHGPAKEKDTKSAGRYFDWTPGGHETKDKYTPAGDAQMSSSSPSDGAPGPGPYTYGVNFVGRNVTEPGSRGGHRLKRATGPRQCTADVQCAPTECCLEDQLGANPLALVCVPRQNNGYCGRPKACRYTHNCKPPAERCVLTRVIFHPRYWGVPIGHCATQ